MSWLRHLLQNQQHGAAAACRIDLWDVLGLLEELLDVFGSDSEGFEMLLKIYSTVRNRYMRD